MNAELKEAFSRIKPVCDVVMVCPSTETISAFTNHVSKLKKSIVQELQQYMLFPFITHIKSKEIEQRYDLQQKLIDAMRLVLEKVIVNSYEMCIEIQTGLLTIIFDSSKDGMVAEIPEELKLSVMRCSTVLMINLDYRHRIQLLKTQVPLIAQGVFVAVHIAKLDRLRILRLSAIDCVTAHTVTHAKQTNEKYHISDPGLEALVVDMLSSILPGVLAALQDVSTCKNNPGHAVIVSSLDAIHRIMCITMQDKFLSSKAQRVSSADFAKLIRAKTAHKPSDVSTNDKKSKDVTKRSAEWYNMAGEKLALVTNSVVSLKTHEHFKVRKELAILCYRILSECNITMQPSLSAALDVLITLAKDPYIEVSQYCADALKAYLAMSSGDTRLKTMETLSENLCSLLATLPRILNNIDTTRKLSSLSLLHGYLQVLSSGQPQQPQQLTMALSSEYATAALCSALTYAAAHSSFDNLGHRVSAPMDMSPCGQSGSPWRRLSHLDSGECERRLQDICRLLGHAECGELILDRLLEMFQRNRACELVYVMNYMAVPECPSIFTRILDTYLDSEVWYSPLEVSDTDEDEGETLDPTVYNPRAWIKQSVPDLYESATEVRYTEVPYHSPRPRPSQSGQCGSLGVAQRNMLLSCCLVEGLGVLAAAGFDMQPHLLRILCLVLERIGSKYEMLHVAGVQAIEAISRGTQHASVPDLIKANADYFTSEITKRLKKAWNTESALQILTVVIEYSDATILDCLYGIVQDVLVQSCDKYYENNLYAYLQVFLTFIQSIKRWFPETSVLEVDPTEINILKELLDYTKGLEETQRLLSDGQKSEMECEKSAQELYEEDERLREENCLDYDDKVTTESPPPPQHVTVAVTIMKRCVNFISAKSLGSRVLAMQVVGEGLPLLRRCEDVLLPLVHSAWPPLLSGFRWDQPLLARHALQLLATMADLARDFIRSRTVKEVLPNMYHYLHKSSSESYLKDKGSYYRTSQAYSLQVSVLTALPDLVEHLALDDDPLDEALYCVDNYLSRKQPKPLQELAVKFFRSMLEYDIGATWYHLRKFCNNSETIEAPSWNSSLLPVVGTPYDHPDKDYAANVKLIFNVPKANE